jgi:SAM-dependent methyltransferase
MLRRPSKNFVDHGMFYGRTETGEWSHLGGCAMNGDGSTYYPHMWSYMIEKYNIKSMIDVGCGAGFTLDYFKDLGVKVRGVEGCKEVVERNLVSKDLLVLHDYENDGSYTPPEEFDLCWSCEFVEHVEEKCMNNFLETFKKSKVLAITYAYPGQTGFHHVNEQHEPYWIKTIENIGFVYNQKDTIELRTQAKIDSDKYTDDTEAHFVKRGLVFINLNHKPK